MMKILVGSCGKCLFNSKLKCPKLANENSKKLIRDRTKEILLLFSEMPTFGELSEVLSH